MNHGKKPCDMIHDAIVEVCERKETRLAHKAEPSRIDFVELLYNTTDGKPILRFHYGVYGFWEIEELSPDAKDIFMLIMQSYYDMIKR